MGCFCTVVVRTTCPACGVERPTDCQYLNGEVSWALPRVEVGERLSAEDREHSPPGRYVGCVSVPCDECRNKAFRESGFTKTNETLERWVVTVADYYRVTAWKDPVQPGPQEDW